MFERRTVQTVYGEVAAWAGGHGPSTLLYLHAEVSVAPDPVATALARSSNVVMPIHPGFDDAPRPEWVETVRDIADLYVEATRLLSGDGALAVVGASLGGWIAAELALLIASRVASLVLIGPAGLFSPEVPPGDHWFATDDERAAMLFEDLGRMPAVDMDEFVANDETSARYAWNPRFCDPTLNYRIRRLEVPTLLVWGEADRLLPIGQSGAWLEALPQARLEAVPGSGHFPAYEDPERVASLIRGFVGMEPATATTAREER